MTNIRICLAILSPPSQCNFTQYTVHILYVDQLETIALTTEIRKYGKNNQKHIMWLRSRRVLQDIYINTLPFWDENKIRNKFTEASGDIEHWVSGYNKTLVAWFLYTTSLYTSSWSHVNQVDIHPFQNYFKSPFLLCVLPFKSVNMTQ